MATRRRNERTFGSWEELPDGGRIYRLRVQGRSGRYAVYEKEVDASERTCRFVQKVYNDEGRLVEEHVKFPVDKGHRRVQ